MPIVVRVLIASCFGCILAGCGFFDTGTFWESGKFSVFWIDTHSNSTLGYDMGSGSHIGIVESCVFAAGSNEKYVAVKRAPRDMPGEVLVFLLNRSKFDPSKDPKLAMSPPFTEKAYDLISRQNGFPALVEFMPESLCHSEA